MTEPEKYGIPYRPEALLMYHANPFTNAGDSATIEKALKQLDMVVSINLYLDESTDFADVVLSEHTYLERDNLINFSHDMQGLQIGQPVVPPLHDTKDGMDILIELADRSGFLGGPDGYNAALNRLLELRDHYALDTQRKYTYAEILDRQARCHSNGEKGLAWYREHGNDFRTLKPDEIYRIYRDARLPLFFNYIKDVGDELKANLEKHEVEKTFGLKINTDVYKGIPYWEPSPVHEPDGDYDFFLISYKNYMTTYADTATNPIMMEVSRRDPLLMRVVINAGTAKRKGIRDGDAVWVESRYARAKGVAGVTEGIHPQTAAISGGFGRWTRHPVAHGKGIAQNPHLPMDLKHTGMLGGSMETVGKVRIYPA
jgi:anaerobic selenocysteine-containing dehydrogenase